MMWKERGFTLVELSIVLVIIGLLIGGILVAQSMISTARVAQAIKQLQQFDTAVTDFQTKYNSFPGDSSVMGCVNDPGYNLCDNGVVEDDYLAYPAVRPQIYNGELSNFGPNLQQSGFLAAGGATFSNANAGAFASFSVNSATPNSPQFALGTNTGVIIFRDAQWANPNRHYYFLANWTPIGNVQQGIPQAYALAISQSVSARDALALDTKIDDGSAAQSTGAIVMPWGAGASCTSGSQYNVSGGGLCSLVVAVGGTNGTAP